VFWNRKPYRDRDRKYAEGAFYKRRHSINILNKHYVQWDRENLDDSTDWPWDQYHLEMLGDYRSLREWYRKDNIDVFDTKRTKRAVYIVRDFRKHDYDDDVSTSPFLPVLSVRNLTLIGFIFKFDSKQIED
jgi:hypothetical protein